MQHLFGLPDDGFIVHIQHVIWPALGRYAASEKKKKKTHGFWASCESAELEELALNLYFEKPEPVLNCLQSSEEKTVPLQSDVAVYTERLD